MWSALTNSKMYHIYPLKDPSFCNSDHFKGGLFGHDVVQCYSCGYVKDGACEHAWTKSRFEWEDGADAGVKPVEAVGVRAAVVEAVGVEAVEEEAVEELGVVGRWERVADLWTPQMTVLGFHLYLFGAITYFFE